MLNIAAVFIGGGIGAVVRYLIGLLYLYIFKTSFFPATFLINILGCFILGFLYIFFIEKFQVSSALKLTLTVGFCGGLTTFSTFSLEIFEMLQNNQLINAFVYLILSVIIGVVAVYLGGSCAKFL